MALQLTNGSAHFHAVEVTASPPPALPPIPGGVWPRQGSAANAAAGRQLPVGSPLPPGAAGVMSSMGNPVPPPTVLPVPSMELTGYSRFIVELLPGAAKTVSFTLVPHATGQVALPLVSLRASTGSKVGGASGTESRVLSPAGELLYTLSAAGLGGAGLGIGGASARQVRRPSAGTAGLPFAVQPVAPPVLPVSIYVKPAVGVPA